jgi:hypothetical protein
VLACYLLPADQRECRAWVHYEIELKEQARARVGQPPCRRFDAEVAHRVRIEVDTPSAGLARVLHGGTDVNQEEACHYSAYHHDCDSYQNGPEDPRVSVTKPAEGGLIAMVVDEWSRLEVLCCQVY